MFKPTKKLLVVPAFILVLALAGCTSNSAPIQIQSTPRQSAPTSPELKEETRTVTETVEIECDKKTVNDPGLEKGEEVITTECKNGVKTLTFEVTTVDGKENKELVKEEVTTEPVAQVTAIGTKEAPKAAAPTSQCDPNYTGCVPIASDVDCAGGSGNGPAYASGPIQVIGSDIYDLDRDGDGIACD